MQRHGSNYFAIDPHPTLGMGSVGQNSTFSEHGHVAYQVKENHECSIMNARRPPIPSRTIGMGSVGQNLTILEHCHVAYQIKGNQECSNMEANILPTYPTPKPCDGSKFNFFQNMAMFIIN